MDRRGASVLGTKAAACPNPTSRTEPESKRISTSVLVGREGWGKVREQEECSAMRGGLVRGGTRPSQKIAADDGGLGHLTRGATPATHPPSIHHAGCNDDEC